MATQNVWFGIQHSAASLRSAATKVKGTALRNVEDAEIAENAREYRPHEFPLSASSAFSAFLPSYLTTLKSDRN